MCCIEGRGCEYVKRPRPSPLLPAADAFGPIPIHPWPDSAFLNGFSALGAVFEAGHTTTGLVYELDEAQYNRTVRWAEIALPAPVLQGW